MEEDLVEMEHDQVIMISTLGTEGLMEEMLTTMNNQSDKEQPVTNSIKSSSSSLRSSSERHAEIQPEMHTLLLDPTPPRKTGRRSARQRSKLYAQSLEVHEMDIDKVEEKQTEENVEQQPNEKNGGVAPPPLRFHKEMLSKNYIQFALKVLGCEYEVIEEPGWRKAKQFYEEAMSDPFVEYACENVPDPSAILPPFGYYNNMEKELIEFDRDVKRCKELPNFGFPVSFDSDVSVHFETAPEKDYYEFGNGNPQLGSSGEQSRKGK
ncbi:unnamed protein product [Linum tenue]|uniref:Uncharacterized protein n=1 Tax=Linum tenue TaxID=586396 RepID=A0AAV0Q0J0_9ROSI|nr:unnamed protein product [Linum tenue]